MKNIVFDMWYGNSVSEVDKADCFWSDCDCVYRGNVYNGGRIIGDYTAKSVQAIEKALPQLAGDKR